MIFSKEARPFIMIPADECLKTDPFDEPLGNSLDELMAELLAQNRTFTATVRAGKGKFTIKELQRVYHGKDNRKGKKYAKKDPVYDRQRSDQFRGRVHFFIREMHEEAKAQRYILITGAMGVYLDAVNRRGHFKKTPGLNLSAAKDILTGFNVFEPSAKTRSEHSINANVTTNLTDEELMARVKRAMERKKNAG